MLHDFAQMHFFMFFLGSGPNLASLGRQEILFKNASVKISIDAAERLLKNSLDKSKLDKLYLSSIEETKLALKKKSS